MEIDDTNKKVKRMNEVRREAKSNFVARQCKMKNEEAIKMDITVLI